MKRVLLLLMALCVTHGIRSYAQDAATEERLNKISGQIEDLSAAQEVEQRQIAELAKEVEAVRKQLAQPEPNYASQSELSRLDEVIRELDRKRLEDYEKTRVELVNLGKLLTLPPVAPKQTSLVTSARSYGPCQAATPEAGFAYMLKSGDTLSAIIRACRKKSTPVSLEQILKANPGWPAYITCSHALPPTQSL